MKIIIRESYDEVSRVCAEMIISQVTLKNDSVLGFATGSSPVGCYQELIEIHNKRKVSFKDAKAFNLDEYIGLSGDKENSYSHFMRSNLFNGIDIQAKNCHIPNGDAVDILKECMEYERLIKREGGIDLQLLGIGRNAHIGFNEPDVNFEALTHVVTLDEDTVEANARFFETIDQVPTKAISMGIKSIMNCRKVVLIASGSDKAEAVEKMIKGKITPRYPASVLQLHNDVTIILDKEAAGNL